MARRAELKASISGIETILERIGAVDQDGAAYKEALNAGPDTSLLGSPAQSEVATHPISQSERIDQPIWMGAQQVLATVQRPMTAPEIARMLQALDWPISGDTPAETVRTALSRKPELFIRVNRGRFLLREWRVDLLPPGFQMRQQGQIDTKTQIILAEKSGAWATWMLARNKPPTDMPEWPSRPHGATFRFENGMAGGLQRAVDCTRTGER
jgi:hypothetical protein